MAKKPESSLDRTAEELWACFETEVDSFDILIDRIHKISLAASESSRELAWRGQEDYRWGLTSKLYREFLKSNPHRLTEDSFSEVERKILKSLRQWGLHSSRLSGRLSVLSQIAMLQHFGAPTRFIDVSFNALIAAFFATEKSALDDIDGRICIIDVTGRIINENKYLRSWEDSLDTPWSGSFIENEYLIAKSRNYKKYKGRKDEFIQAWKREWSTHYYAWKPPGLDPRIAAQNGGFILGGLVGTRLSEGFIDRSGEESSSTFQLYDPRDEARKRLLNIADTRKFSCLAIRPQSFPDAKMRVNTKSAVYSIRIKASAKADIRKRLSSIYGFKHSTIYPDFPGFSLHGVPPLIPGHQ